MSRKPSPEDIEISVGPHSARPDWSVLRVTFQRTPEHQRRVATAVGMLLPSTTEREGGRGEESTQRDDAA